MSQAGSCHAVGVERDLSSRTGEYLRAGERRKDLARRLAAELAGDSHRAGSDFVSSRMVQARYSSTVEIVIALDTAPTALLMGGPDTVGVSRGRAGAVVWVHVPDDWSVVFPVDPFTGLILICADQLEDRHCFQLWDDSPEGEAAVARFRVRVESALTDRASLAESGAHPADWPALPLLR